MLRKAALFVGAALVAGSASAQQGKPVPEIHFLSWPAATYSHFAETSNHVVEEWEKLGLRVRLDQVAFPNPMLQMWFTATRLVSGCFGETSHCARSSRVASGCVGCFMGGSADRLAGTTSGPRRA